MIKIEHKRTNDRPGQVQEKKRRDEKKRKEKKGPQIIMEFEHRHNINVRKLKIVSADYPQNITNW